MKQWKWLLVVGVLIHVQAMAQVPVQLKVSFHNAGQPFELNETITALNGTDYNVQSMAFYVSRVEIIHDGNQITALDTNEVFVIKHTAPVAYLGTLNVTEIEGIRFHVGVPEYLNHLDISLYHGSHPLSFQDPVMHWGWAAGYMHMVMNGKGDNDNDGIPTVAYELNNLGDENVPVAEVFTAATVYPDAHQEITLICNVDEWLRGTDPATTGPAHGSDPVNAMVMQNVEDYPVFTAPANASVVEKEQIELVIAQSASVTTVSWSDARVESYLLTDANGRMLKQGSCSAKQLEFTGLKPGLHIVQLLNAKNSRIGTAKWIVP